MTAAADVKHRNKALARSVPPRQRCGRRATHHETGVLCTVRRSLKRPVQNSLLISTIAHSGVVRGSEALVLICRYVVVNTVPRNSPESSLRPAGRQQA